jgi:hypothetical protein
VGNEFKILIEFELSIISKPIFLKAANIMVTSVALGKFLISMGESMREANMRARLA